MLLRDRRLPAIVVAPLMLGIGIRIGAVGSASASTVSTAFTGALKTAATSLQCMTTQPCVTVTSSAKGGVAILASNPNGLGIEGLSTSSSAVTGTSQYSNGVNGKSSTGIAVHGVSANANGVVGTSNGGASAVGVLGTSTFSARLANGNEAPGGVGVQAFSVAGSGLVVSNGPDPNGLFQISTAPTAVINATGTFADGLDISTGFQTSGPDYPSAGPAIVTTSGSGGSTAEVGAGDSGISATNDAEHVSGGYGPPGVGIFGSSTYGNGIVGSTESGPTAASTGENVPIAAVNAEADKGADLYLGFGKGTFEVTNDGSVNASGTITSGVTCAPTTCGDGTRLATYAPHDASPTVEDFGRSQLINGSAIVRLDPMFAGTISATKDYYVFLTAEGNNRGLYVTRRTPQGFAVGESLNGHSTLAFSYRIVASPYGSIAPRLPAIRTQRYAVAAFAHEQKTLAAMKGKSAQIRARMPKLLMPDRKSEAP